VVLLLNPNYNTKNEREKSIVYFPCGCPGDALIYKKQEGSLRRRRRIRRKKGPHEM
jgi:hypothetical protein